MGKVSLGYIATYALFFLPCSHGIVISGRVWHASIDGSRATNSSANWRALEGCFMWSIGRDGRWRLVSFAVSRGIEVGNSFSGGSMGYSRG